MADKKKKYDNSGLLCLNNRPAMSDETFNGSATIKGVQFQWRGYLSPDHKMIELQIHKALPKGDYDRLKPPKMGAGQLNKEAAIKNPKHPNWRGELTTASGLVCELAAWAREPTGNITKPWLSVKISPKKPEKTEQQRELEFANGS